MTEIVLKVASEAALHKKWNQHIKHGVIFAPVHPVPKEGADVVVRIRPTFSTELIDIQGYVAQASVGISVVQLRGLDDAARKKLVALGIAEAADALVGDEARSTGSFAAISDDDVEPVADLSHDPDADVTLESAAPGAPVAPTPVAPQAEPAPAPEPAPAEATPEAPKFTPGAAKFTPGAAKFTPGAAKFTPGAAKFTPGAAKFTPGAAKFTPGASKFTPGGAPFKPKTAPRRPPPKVGDLTDVRVVGAIDGPATEAAQALLPAPMAEGAFGDETWRDVVLRVTTARTTGIVVVNAFREIRWAYFVDGGPVHYAGKKEHAGEYLSDALIADGAVTLEQWTDAVRMATLLDMKPGDYLVSQGRLSRDALDAAITRRAERITRNLIGTNFGTWSIHEVPAVRSAFTNRPVSSVNVLMDTERKAQQARDNELLIREVEPFYKHHVQLNPARKHLLPALELHDNERYVVDEMLSAGWTIGELVAFGGMLERPLLRLLEALRGMGFVDYVEEEGEVSKRNRAERILWIGLRDLERRNDFEAVHAHWSSTKYELDTGYRKLIAEFGAERFADVADDRIRDLIRQIRTKADAIHQRLSDRNGRRRAREGHVANDQLLMAVDLLDKQAQMALWKSDFAFVKACYERVIDLDPGVPEAAEARKNARKALADPRIQTAKLPGEDRMRQLNASFDALGES